MCMLWLLQEDVSSSICRPHTPVGLLPLLGGEAQRLPSGLHDLSSPGLVLRALRAQEAAQLVLLLGQNCTDAETSVNTQTDAEILHLQI